MNMNSKLPKSGSVMRGDENRSFKLWRMLIRFTPNDCYDPPDNSKISDAVGRSSSSRDYGSESTETPSNVASLSKSCSRSPLSSSDALEPST